MRLNTYRCAAAIAALAGASAAALAQQPPARPGPIAPMEHAAKYRRGSASFTDMFDADAVGYNARNAYILSYLSSAIYPDGLAKVEGIDTDSKDKKVVDYLVDLNRNRQGSDTNFFETRFRDELGYLFASSSFRYFAPPRNPDGYDPEAMVIDTPAAIFVVFRGTDRVGSARPDSPEWGAGEWLGTDFRCAQIAPGFGIKGLVHEGMWRSLEVERTPGKKDTQFRNELLGYIKDLDKSSSKKLWITGHSLGGGLVQLFGAYCESQGRQVQGAYTYAGPCVGNKEFCDWVESKLTRGVRLQRFEFLDDPVTILGPQPFYQGAGVRNQFDGIRTLKAKMPERKLEEVLLVLPALENIIKQAIAGALKAEDCKIPLSKLNSFCFHHWEWYVASASRALPKADRTRFPAPFKLLDASDEGCDPNAINMAKHGDPDGPDDKVKEVVDQIEYVANNVIGGAKLLMKNASGEAIPEGTYTLRCLKDKQYLEVQDSCFKTGSNGCEVQLDKAGDSKANNRFKIKRDGLFYHMEINGKFVEADADDVFDNGCRIQVWGPFLLTPPHQQWLFCPIKGNKYMIVNAMSGKALDAVDAETAKAGGRLQLYKPHNNDPTQVWILDKVN